LSVQGACRDPLRLHPVSSVLACILPSVGLQPEPGAGAVGRVTRRGHV
jgi:hypothetical protein